jgi:hypothetical protein
MGGDRLCFGLSRNTSLVVPENKVRDGIDGIDGITSALGELDAGWFDVALSSKTTKASD